MDKVRNSKTKCSSKTASNTLTAPRHLPRIAAGLAGYRALCFYTLSYALRRLGHTSQRTSVTAARACVCLSLVIAPTAESWPWHFMLVLPHRSEHAARLFRLSSDQTPPRHVAKSAFCSLPCSPSHHKRNFSRRPCWFNFVQPILAACMTA